MAKRLAPGVNLPQPCRQHCHIQILRNLPDVVLRRQKAMYVAVYHHPAVALRVGAAAVEVAGGVGQLAHQLRIGRG
jgi:hypothetical protein